jgi:hypothetical protein
MPNLTFPEIKVLVTKKIQFIQAFGLALPLIECQIFVYLRPSNGKSTLVNT